ncbi:MAG TPA: Maf family protein [Candidatus Angelobacter sp.]|nr:Maf family protein [Candidatus Angelobacter sp.]
MHPQNNSTLILASSSPRRQELLRQTGIPFQVHAPHINEDQLAAEKPGEYALRLAREKAQAVAAHYPQSYVLGADTIVVVSGEVLGKPRDHADAARMLRQLSGRGHEVTTAVSLIAPDALAPSTRTQTRTCTTKVYFRELTEDEIQQYVASGEPMDKAGAYAIQGGASRWTDRIEGEWSNVVGLPLSLVTDLLRTNGLLNLKTLK